MASQDITLETFEDTIASDGIVLLDFWAGWCGPCMRFAPIYETAAERHTDVTFAKVDTEAERDLAAGLEITSIPTIMAFRDGMLVFRQAGLLNGAQLDKLIEQIKDLDMDDLKKQAAEKA